MMRNKKIISAIIILIAIGLGFLYLSYGPQPGPSEQPIQPEQPIEQPELKKVFVNGTNFATEDGDFRFIGAYTVPLLEFMAYNTYFTDWKDQIDVYMDAYANSFKDAGPLVMKFQAFGPYEANDPEGQFGKRYAEPNWERLDYIVNKAEKNGIYLIWWLWNYWSYESTSQGVYPRYSYWDDARIKPAIESMVRRYKDRNVIMSWQIINEGDVNEMWYPETHKPMLNWINNISTFIKSIDQDSIVSTGFASELRTPYFEAPREYEHIRKFIKDVHSLPNIDVISVHFYGGNIDAMTNLSDYSNTWYQQVRWHVEEIAKLRAELGKPVLGGEWGVQRPIERGVLKYLYRFMIDLFAQHKIDNVFNGWGNKKQPPSLLIYSDDTELIAILREGMERIKR